MFYNSRYLIILFILVVGIFAVFILTSEEHVESRRLYTTSERSQNMRRSALIYPYNASFRNDLKESLASVFFTDSITVEDLRNNYVHARQGEDKIKVLIVPGHDPDSGGAEFRELKERDLNVSLAKELRWLLTEDKIFEVILTRDQKEYDPIFAEYFDVERESIEKFVKRYGKKMKDLIGKGLITNVEGVPHSDVNSEMALRLYGINKWTNENDIDIAIHVHFNDCGSRKWDQAGEYSGFSIYIPEKQYSNGKVSMALAQPIFNQVEKYYPKSNLPKEDQGIVPDRKLIAIGANNTLDSPVVLIEYGYIYEPQFRYKEIRDAVLRELAFRTHEGIIDFFENKDTSDDRENTFLLSSISKDTIKKGDKNTRVLSLQTALSFENLYPPSGLSRHDCLLDGIFGRCTLLAVKAFQRKYSLGVDGIAGPVTIGKINEIIRSTN